RPGGDDVRHVDELAGLDQGPGAGGIVYAGGWGDRADERGSAPVLGGLRGGIDRQILPGNPRHVYGGGVREVWLKDKSHTGRDHVDPVPGKDTGQPGAARPRGQEKPD